ncbi:MAG: hypothetical protein R3C15_18470 [Thermoleophilia bacterium]
MATRVYVLHRLREGVAPETYERWVQEVDYPLTDGTPEIASYQVVRLSEQLMGGEGAPPWDYLELIEPADYDAYIAKITSPDLQGFFAEWSSHVADFVAMKAETVDRVG